MQTIKKNWVYLLLSFAIIFFVYKKIIQTKEVYKTETFKTNTGWGYTILKDDKVYIHQEIIPAIEGFKSFTTKEEAEKVGKFVVDKMKKKEGAGFPQITVEEIDSLKISR